MSDRTTLIGLAFGVFMLTAAGVGLIVYEADHRDVSVQAVTTDKADR